MLENQWKYQDRPELGLMNIINSVVRNLDVVDSSALPNVRRGSVILIGSDYSGQHETSLYESLAFVLADIEHCQSWAEHRRRIRAKFLGDGRRLSYKVLRDKRRMDSLSDFLESANHVFGLLVVILTRKSIESLFKKSGRIERADTEIRPLAHWAPHVVEKLLRITHFISLFLAGLSREGQDVLWITDEDEIVANEQRHQEMTSAFGNICSHYLKHRLGKIRVSTTASDTGKRDVEDFVSIADLAAGALCEVLNAYFRGGNQLTSNLILPPPAGLENKALNVLNWFSERGNSLKRLVFTIDPIPDSTSLSVKHLTFHGSDNTSQIKLRL